MRDRESQKDREMERGKERESGREPLRKLEKVYGGDIGGVGTITAGLIDKHGPISRWRE